MVLFRLPLLNPEPQSARLAPFFLLTWQGSGNVFLSDSDRVYGTFGSAQADVQLQKWFGKCFVNYYRVSLGEILKMMSRSLLPTKIRTYFFRVVEANVEYAFYQVDESFTCD